jgi:murein DD-endopeptidase MepM/ murein hydrolase activator NlpD
VLWRGNAGRRTAAAGSYDFRIAVGSQVRSRAGSSGAAGGEFSAGRFTFLSDLFPVRGPHSYGGRGARFGAGRSGHRHQGQDVPAKCGTPLVAARGGRVRWRASQSAAGNYLVIDGAGTSLDTVYMHLTAPALVKKGQRVYTGQRIGYVGDTGDAQGCHLHFEIWSGGWYQRGGHPIDPLGYLRAWDRVS